MDYKAMAHEFFPHGLPELPEQWLDFAEHIAEAQHRKTWALAMEQAEEAAMVEWPYPKAMSNAISSLPCPPIEATKDK